MTFFEIAPKKEGVTVVDAFMFELIYPLKWLIQQEIPTLVTKSKSVRHLLKRHIWTMEAGDTVVLSFKNTQVSVISRTPSAIEGQKFESPFELARYIALQLMEMLDPEDCSRFELELAENHRVALRWEYFGVYQSVVLWEAA